MPKITFPTIDLIRDYFDDQNLGTAIVSALEKQGKEEGSVIGNDGYYYEHQISDEQLSKSGTVYSVINNQRDIFPVQYFGIDIPVFLRSTSKTPTKKTIVIIGQDPLRSKDNIREGYKEGGINIIHEGTPYAIEIDTVNTKRNTSNLKRYRPIISKLLENYNVYLTDALKCWIGDSTGENISYGKLNPKLSSMSQKTPGWLLEQEIICLENGNNTLNENLEIPFVACFGNTSYTMVKDFKLNKQINVANHPGNMKRYPDKDKTNYIIKEVLGTLTEEEKEEFSKLNQRGNSDISEPGTVSVNTKPIKKYPLHDEIKGKIEPDTNAVWDALAVEKLLVAKMGRESVCINGLLGSKKGQYIVQYVFHKFNNFGLDIFWNRVSDEKKQLPVLEKILDLTGGKRKPQKGKNSDTEHTGVALTYCINDPAEYVEIVKNFENELEKECVKGNE